MGGATRVGGSSDTHASGALLQTILAKPDELSGVQDPRPYPAEVPRLAFGINRLRRFLRVACGWFRSLSGNSHGTWSLSADKSV